MSLEGSMTDPEFLLRFTYVGKAPSEVVAPERGPEPAPTPTSASASTPAVAPTSASAPATDQSEDRTVRADGRVYSVALIAEADVSVGAEVLAQGRIANFGYAQMMRSRPFAVINDEQQTDSTLMCAMREQEGAEVLSLYHVGDVVRVSGQYFGTLGVAGNPPMPIIMDCQMAAPQNDIVRPPESTRR